MKIFFLVVVLCSNIFQTNAQQSVLDTSFNHTGKLFTNITGMLTSCLVQPDGKIVIGGTGRINNSSRFAISRLLSNGNYDYSFGANGILYDSFYNSLSDQINCMLLQPDGKIIAIGTSDSFINLYISIARYMPNGALDNTFGSNGKLKLAQTNFGSINSATLQPDGKIVLAGKNGGFNLLRLQSDGLFDSTFGTYGKVLTNIGTLPYSGANAVLLQANGKIVAGGSSYHNTYYWAAMIRYLANGTLDNTFGTNGVVETNVRGYDDAINSLVQQPDGKIIATGNSTINSGSASTALLLLQYDTSGNLDNTFNGSGKLVKSIGGSDDKCYKAILQTDGKIVVGGYTTTASINLDYAMYRANADGTDDNTFGANGVVTGNFVFNTSNFNDHGQTIAIQPDGKLIIAGYSALSGAGSYALMRFTNQINVGVTNVESLSQQQLMVYPNPTTNQLTIVSHQFSVNTIEVRNMVGQIVFNKQLNNSINQKIQLDVSRLSSGIYFSKAIDDNGMQHTVKFVKE